jgi:NAD(P)-dependent dehydrogenase (short-subunit alcohol dehydrogenase family)
MPLLQSHIAVVTGAGSGIGRSIAHGYAREGARLVLLDANEKATAKSISGSAACIRRVGAVRSPFVP